MPQPSADLLPRCLAIPPLLISKKLFATIAPGSEAQVTRIHT
jgi:hypothetical protein